MLLSKHNKQRDIRNHNSACSGLAEHFMPNALMAINEIGN